MTTPLRVLGLDLSLTSTGIAYLDGDNIHTGILKSANKGPAVTDQRKRLQDITAAVWKYVGSVGGPPDLAVIEGPSYGSKGAGTWDRAGLWWMVVDSCIGNYIPVAIAPPACRARYATGKGNADKDLVLAETVRRFDRILRNDEADALILAAMGADHLGRPLVTMPATHRTGLDKVAWPEVAS
jgi:Holliday junction resolvasome RuvABC endonuclease subunit